MGSGQCSLCWYSSQAGLQGNLQDGCIWVSAFPELCQDAWGRGQVLDFLIVLWALEWEVRVREELPLVMTCRDLGPLVASGWPCKGVASAHWFLVVPGGLTESCWSQWSRKGISPEAEFLPGGKLGMDSTSLGRILTRSGFLLLPSKAAAGF